MRLKHAKTLITGKPGVGKTTLVQGIIKRMQSVKMAGFYTAEIRCSDTRMGFELFGLNGELRTLAHVDIDSQYRVGRYGVDIDGFEGFLNTLNPFDPDVDLIVIDEIGKMELFSNHFQVLVRSALDSDKQVLATIPLKGGKFVWEIKQRSDIRLVEVTHDNRDRLLEKISEGLQIYP